MDSPDLPGALRYNNTQAHHGGANHGRAHHGAAHYGGANHGGANRHHRRGGKFHGEAEAYDDGEAEWH